MHASWCKSIIYTFKWTQQPLLKLQQSHVAAATEPYCSSFTLCKSTMYTFACIIMHDTEWRRPTGCLVVLGHFPQKSPVISGSLAKNDLQLKAAYESLLPRRATKHASWHSLLHLECHWIVISNLNFVGLFSTERGKRDLENWWLIEIWDWRNDTPNAVGRR